MSMSRDQKAGKVRIIGGEWRGRKLPVCALDGLRPTGDRVRETLFNWLQADIRATNCLDLFAGTGALGFEALSRAAKHVDFVEKHKQAALQLEENIKLLKAQAQVRNTSAEDYLSNFEGEKYGLVFIDPPFAANLWQDTFEALINADCLTENALVYLESPINPEFTLPPGWEIQKSKNFGSIAAKVLQIM